jgi:cell division protein FtsB
MPSVASPKVNTTRRFLTIFSSVLLLLSIQRMLAWMHFEYAFECWVMYGVLLTRTKFQFLGLVTFGIAVATKFRNLQTAHSHLKDQTDKLRLEKTEAETEIQALTDRITLAEEKERKYKAKEPEIKHYLEKFALAKK